MLTGHGRRILRMANGFGHGLGKDAPSIDGIWTQSGRQAGLRLAKNAENPS
jgi:hypothetical protein